MLAFRVNHSIRICMAQYKGKQLKDQIQHLWTPRHGHVWQCACWCCLIALLSASRESFGLATWLKGCPFSHLHSYHHLTNVSLQILKPYLFFPFERILLRIVTKMLGSTIRWNFWILLQRSDECAWIDCTLILCLSFLCRLKTTGLEHSFLSFCMILSCLRSLISFEATWR